MSSSVFTFRAGAFAPADDPIGGDCDVSDFEKAGYGLSQSVGDENGLSYELYESEADWIVVFQTVGRYCLVRCSEWPDLIELLARLSPIVLAAVIDEETLGAVHEALRPYREAVEMRKWKGKGKK